jgi:Glycosyl transferases group 1
MKSIVLVPYCPLPADHGGKAEMFKHLEILRSLGECTIASAATRPVGMGWGPNVRGEIEKRGYHVVLREETYPSRTWRQWAGMAYASMYKGLKLDQAFGHSNLYHRYAFDSEWWQEVTSHAELAVINYSYWAWLPTHCPKAIILHDLYSNLMWGGNLKETEDLRSADLVIVISKDEQELYRRGIKNVLWSPPLVRPASFYLSQKVGIVGSANPHNREGLQWLSTAVPPDLLSVNVYGGLSQFVNWPNAIRVKSYIDPYQPYQDCGIVMLPTAMGTGVQIKAVEALACGRAIVARRGAMRGVPDGQGAWIEVDSPREMWLQAERLCCDEPRRNDQGEKARLYYQRHLDHEKIVAELRQAYCSLLTGAKVD